MKTLIVYFSYTAGNTKRIAEKVQKAIGASALCKAKSLSSSIIEEASKEDDIYRHIDIWVGANSVDVKASKKTNRSDLLPNYDIHWIEPVSYTHLSEHYDEVVAKQMKEILRENFIGCKPD